MICNARRVPGEYPAANEIRVAPRHELAEPLLKATPVVAI
jgi:hypothetical protein